MNFYRYSIAFGDFPRLFLEVIPLKKETPKGYWISPYSLRSTWRWIPKVSRKRYAYPTKEEALQSFIMRKTRQMQYLTRDLKAIEYTLQEAKNLQKELIHDTGR